MKFLFKTFFRIIFIAFAIGIIYHYRESWADFINPPKPCTKPISYSIGNFDPKFGITKQDFLQDIKKSEEVWENAVGKNLFEYSDTGELKINLTYDYRQQTTDQLKQVGGAINNDRNVYDTLKIKYNQQKQNYSKEESVFEQKSIDYDNQKQEYEKQVTYWNAHGGAPKYEYQSLQNQKNSLNQQIAILNQYTSNLNNLSKELNTTVNAINEVAKKLNLKVTDYNTIGSSTGEEFREGEYISDENGKKINVYQFGDNDKLIRLLEHEFGHALGLDHVDDPQAIMYRLNLSTNKSPSEADIKELQRVCGQYK